MQLAPHLHEHTRQWSRHGGENALYLLPLDTLKTVLSLSVEVFNSLLLPYLWKRTRRPGHWDGPVLHFCCRCVPTSVYMISSIHSRPSVWGARVFFVAHAASCGSEANVTSEHPEWMLATVYVFHAAPPHNFRMIYIFIGHYQCA